MRAILIDAVAKTVTEVDYAGKTNSGLDDLYRLLDCRRVDALQIDGNIFEKGWHSVFYDDRFLRDEANSPRHFFQIQTKRGPSPPIAGKGLVVGHNREHTDDATLTVDQIRAAVTFTERRFRGIRPIKPGFVHDPVFGKVFQFGVTADLPIVDGSNEE
jgi:hypothetical protein